MAFQRVGIIGAGQMGAGIAQVFAVTGTPVRLFDVADSQLERGVAGIAKSLDKFVSKEKISREDTEHS